MILAAGKGERIRPLTLKKPKPLLEVGGKALLAYHLEALSRAGFSEVVINHAWLGDHIAAFVGNGSAWGLNVVCSAEKEPLETAGGILNALPILGREPFLVINGDVWTNFDLRPLQDLSIREGHLVLVENPPHHLKGDFAIDDQGIILSKGQPTWTYSGIAVMHPKLFDGWPSGVQKLKPLLTDAIARGGLSGQCFKGAWVDVGTTERLNALDAQLCAKMMASDQPKGDT